MSNEDPSPIAHSPDGGVTPPETANPDQIQSAPAIQAPPWEGTEQSNIPLPPSFHDDIRDLERPVRGWPQVALLMAKTPDFAAFDRFRDLNIKSLLYYQTQLTLLCKELYVREHKDHRFGGHEHEEFFAKHADLLVECEDSKQWQLVLKIRGLLKEYNEFRIFGDLLQKLIDYEDAALLQFWQVSGLPEPDNYNMNTLRSWLQSPSHGDFCISGHGVQSTWGELYDDDGMNAPVWLQFWRLVWGLIWINPPPNSFGLVATTPPQKYNNFTRWVAYYLTPFFKVIRRSRETQRYRRARDIESTAAESQVPSRAAREREEIYLKPMAVWSRQAGGLTLASPISTIVACLLPTIAIAVLSRVHGLTNLLLCLAGFVVVFAIGVVSFTSCSRVEVFTATAA